MTTDPASKTGTWPYWTLFFCGHFGRATPASRRLNQQTMLGLVILAFAAVVATAADAAWPRSELLLVPGAVFAASGFSSRSGATSPNWTS